MSEKRCGKCREIKPLSAFYSSRRSGESDVCRSCTVGESRSSIPRSEKTRNRTKYLRRTFGLSPDQVVTMKERQGNRCGICAGEMAVPGNGPDSMCVDHDHETNRVRALLHDRCNRLLGCARDNPEVLRRAAAYLEEHREKERLRQEAWR